MPYINVVGLSRDIDEQLKHVHKVIEIAEGAKRKVWVTLLRYKEDNPNHPTRRYDYLHAGRRKRIFNNLSVNYKIDEFIYLLDVMNCL